MKGLKPIEDLEISGIKSVTDLTNQMKLSGGFVAKKVGVACDILKDMVKDKRCVKILSFPACIVATGTRGIIKEIVKRNLVDVIITTCGTLDHDLARVWKDYYHGTFLMDDKELHKKGINREGNILIPNECYGTILEDKIRPLLNKLYKEGKKDFATYELVWELGKMLENEKKKESSIIYWTYKNKIPMFIPGPTDGAVGYQIWFFFQNNHKDFNINLLKDEQKISEIIYSAKKTGALMIGGGISKHHTIWWNQFRNGLDYVVYITTAAEWDGSLSGARIREAISWGKVNEKAKFVTVEGDATVLLPLIITSVLKSKK